MASPRQAKGPSPRRAANGRLRTSIVILLMVLQSILIPLAVVARQSDPSATPLPTSATATRPRCDSPMASATGLVALLRQPVPEDPAAADPAGEPLPPAERFAVGDLIARWSACLASGNVRGFLGLFTADGVRRLFGERSPYVSGPAGLTVTVLAMSDVELLPDGRIAARISIDPSGNGAAAPESLIVLIKQGADGAWRIDHLRSPEGPVGAVGIAERNPSGPPRALLRRPIAPGPDVRAPAPGPAVPMRGGDAARSGNQPGPAPGSAPDERWRTPTGWFSDAQPIVARGMVYFGGFSLGERTALLAAVDMETGGFRWQTTAPVAWAEFSDAPALGGDVLFAPVQAPVAGILAVSAGTGDALWYAPFGFTSVTAPAIDTDVLFTSGWGVLNPRDLERNDTSGAVFSLDQRTGKERWRFLAPVRFGPVAVGGNAIFIPSDHGLYALDRNTGQKRWQARFSPDLTETPVVAGETVVFTGSDITSGKTGIFALDAASGALRWRVELPAVIGVRAGTAVRGDTVYATWWDSTDGQPGTGAPALRAYDLANGKERWVFRISDDGEPIREAGVGALTQPVISGDSVLFGVSIRVPAPGSTMGLDGLYAIDAASGSMRWHTSASTPIDSPPVVLDETIFAMGGLRPRGDATSGSLLAYGAS